MLLRLSSGIRKRFRGLLYVCRRQWKAVICVLAILYILSSWNDRKHPFAKRAHIITGSDIDFEKSHRPDPNLEAEHHGFLPLPEAESLCKAQLWKPYPRRAARRKVYDLLMINDEMDWLEIRLHTLNSTVDYFVIVESPVTFTGMTKPLVLKDNWDRFKEFHEKIIYHQLENPPLGSTRTWDYEDHQRNAMFLQTFPRMHGGQEEPQLGDIILVSDVDEVPRPATIMILRNCDVPKRVTIRSRFYYYSFQYLHRGPEWGHGQATTFGGVKQGQTILPADLRNGEGNRFTGWWDKADLWNAGWHCSTCFETIEQVLTKMSSFSHTGLNKEEYRDPTRIVDRVRKGKDLWDREGEIYDRIVGNEDIPEYLKSDRKRWGYLLNRDGVDAGFRDYTDGDIPGEA